MAAYKRYLLKTIRKRQLHFVGIQTELMDKKSKHRMERFVIPIAEEDNAQNTETV